MLVSGILHSDLTFAYITKYTTISLVTICPKPNPLMLVKYLFRGGGANFRNIHLPVHFLKPESQF